MRALIASRKEMGDAGYPNAVGLYRSPSAGVWVREDAAGHTDYLLVILAHEYVHHVHALVVDQRDLRLCHKLFNEGLAEVGARFLRSFQLSSADRIPPLMERERELGRRVVLQTASEGFGLTGFVCGFLNNLDEENAWRQLDCRFD